MGSGSSSTTGVSFSALDGAKTVVPSSERLRTEGAMELSGEIISTGSLVGTGESRQAAILSGSGQVREEIASAIEALSLGVGIAGSRKEERKH